MKLYQYIILAKNGRYLSIDEKGNNCYVKSMSHAALFDTINDAEFYASKIMGDKIKRLTFVLQEPKK